MSTLRTLAFRILSGAFALLLVLAFGAWRQILSPWVVQPDETDHGWVRTPELHRTADSAASVLFLMLGAALLLLLVRPRGRSGLAAWTGGLLAVTGGLSWLSSAIQGHDLQPGLVTSLVWLALVGLMFLVLHPERRAVLHGGLVDAAGPGPRTRAAATALAVAGLLLAVGAVAWRLTGRVFESPQEDDVLSLVYLGLAWALGGWLLRGGRAGWRPIAAILASSVGYAVVAAVWLAAG